FLRRDVERVQTSFGQPVAGRAQRPFPRHGRGDLQAAFVRSMTIKIRSFDMSGEMTGGEAIARMLKALGAGPIFGMGGFQTLPFYDATNRLDMAHHLINDERAAVFIADAYSKASGG